jgi:hypothetical protein
VGRRVIVKIKGFTRGLRCKVIGVKRVLFCFRVTFNNPKAFKIKHRKFERKEDTLKINFDLL